MCSHLLFEAFLAIDQPTPPHPLKVADFSDLSYLLQPGYTDNLKREIAQAMPWNLTANPQDEQEVIPGHKYLLTFKRMEYSKVAERLNLYRDFFTFRGHLYGVMSIPWR